MLPLLLAIDAKCRMALKQINQWHKKMSWYMEQLQEFIIIVSVAEYNFLPVIQIRCRKVSPDISTMRGAEKIAITMHHARLNCTDEVGVIPKFIAIITIITINDFF
jgi:hypothetical protein